MGALSRGLKSVVKGVDDGFKTIGSKIMVSLPGLIGSTVGLFSRLLDQWSAPPPPPWASENTRLLMMGVATIIIKSFQKNKRWSKKAETSPAEINPTFTISWFILSNLGGVSTLTLIEVLLILFEGSLFETRPRAWEVGLLIFSEPPFMCLTPTEFIPKFTDLLTPGFMSELAFFRLLSYPTILWVLRGRFEGTSQIPGETAWSSRTFASSMASWNLWTLFEMSGLLIASSTNAWNSHWAYFELPVTPKIDDLTLTWEPRRR